MPDHLHHSTFTGFDRRSALAALTATAVIPSLANAAVSPALDTAQARLRAFMLMRGALDDRLVIGCLQGSYFGVVDGVTTPLFDVVSATFARYRPETEGGYAGISIEQAYFVDRTSGAWLTRFANPYTGKSVDVPTGGYPPVRIVFTPDLDMHVPGTPPGRALSHSVSGFRIEGGNVWMTERTVGSTVSPAGKPLSYFETVGLHARASEMAAASVKQVRSETSYTAIKGWRPWLGMGDHPGETISSGQGAYGVTMADLPTPWLAAARRHRPELVANPTAVLDPLWRG